jgi:head-tail adaptor
MHTSVAPRHVLDVTLFTMDLRDAVESPAPVPKKEEHVSVRSIVFGVGAIVFLALMLLLIVEGRRPVDVEGTQGTWGGTGGVEFWGGIARQGETRRSAMQEILEAQRQDGYVHIPAPELSQTTETVDLTGLLTDLIAPAVPVTETSQPIGAYDFIPRGLVSGPPPERAQTALQSELSEYGNSLGGFLLTFEDSHANMLTVLKDAREDLGNAAKAEAAAQIGTDYRLLARDIKEMERVPASARALNIAFADANALVGQNLEVVARARTTQEFLEAVDVYNKSVEGYAEKFVALASLFAAAEVSFAQGDPGSVFTFRGSVASF